MAKANNANTSFEIDGKEYDLVLDYRGVKYLNKVYDGGSFELISKAIMGDLEAFPHILRAALIHTKMNFTLEQIEDRIGELMAEEKLDMQSVLKLSNQLVNDNFFYKATVAKLLKDSPEATELLKTLTE